MRTSSIPDPPFEPLEDVEEHVDWRDVAVVLARAILADGGFPEVVARLDVETVVKANEELRSRTDDYEVLTDWREVYVAAQLLRETDLREPAIRGEMEGPRLARKLLEAQAAASKDARKADPTKVVLISPRIRGNVIERIVQTYSGRVVAEYLHSSSGWHRHGRMDLRVVLEGMPLPARIAEAVCRQKGHLDELPTLECLARFRALDPGAQFTEDDCEYPRQLSLFGDFDDGSESLRLTESEVRDPERSLEPERVPGDASNAEIARAVLESVPALWNSCTLVVEARDDAVGGFDVRIFGPQRDDGYFLHRDSVSLPLLVARRFEMMETARDRAWRRMIFRIARADHPEWQCRVSYDY